MNKKKTNIVTKLLLCVMLLCTLCGALFLGGGKEVSVSAEATTVNYNDLLALENRAWGAHEDEYYFGGYTLGVDPGENNQHWLNTVEAVNGPWYNGNDGLITANNGVDILQYIYVNDKQARQAITENQQNTQWFCTTEGCWLTNPAAAPVFVETSNGSGLMIKIVKAFAGESFTLTFKAGFSLVRNDGAIIELTEDVNYKYENGALTKLEKEPVRVNYNNLLGLEDRAWGSNGDDHYLGGVTLEPFEWFNSADSVNGCWYNGNDAIIAANNGVDILQYIYVNGKQARQAITENQQLATPMVGTSGWLTNPAASPVYVETTNGSGIIIKLLKAWAGESYTFTFKAGFSLIRNDGVIIELTEDVNYKYENGALTKFVPAKECTVTFEGTDVVKTVTEGQAIGELPTVPAKEGYTALGWMINGALINESTVISDSVTVIPSYQKELVKVNYDDQLGLEDRAWGAKEDEYYLGGITLLESDTEYFNSAASVNGCWNVTWDAGYAEAFIAANGGVDIMEYIYVNGIQAREACVQNGTDKTYQGSSGWLANGGVCAPIYVETTDGSGILIKFLKTWAGESYTITFKAGFSLIRNDDVQIYLTKDVNYKYHNGNLNRLGDAYEVTFAGVEETRTILNGDIFGTLPEIPAKDGYVGVWEIDGEIISGDFVYNFNANKTAQLVYYKLTNIVDTIDVANWGEVPGYPNATYFRVGNTVDANNNLMMDTAFDVHWQDHASTAAQNFGCDIMEYILINGVSVREISNKNGTDRTYGGKETDAFPFSFGGVFAPVDVHTNGTNFCIVVMNEYLASDEIVLTFKAGFMMKTSDGGLLYLDEDFVFPYYMVSFGEETSVKVGHGETVAAPDFIPTKAETESHTYTFDGWYLGETKWDFNTPVTAAMNLTAVFTDVEKEKMTVTFDSANGAEATVVSVYVGSYVKEEQIPANPVKETDENLVYTFLFWSLDGETAYDFTTSVTGSITLTAVYTTKPVYEVTMGDTVVVVEEGGKVAKPADPTKESTAQYDYTFLAWYNGDVEWNFDEDVVMGDLTLTAKYTETLRKYTITFNVTGNDAVTFAPVVLEYGETYDLSNLLDGVDLSKHTYAITSGGVAVSSITVLSDVTVDVTFRTKVYYKVTVNGIEYELEVGEKVTKPATDPTKDSTAEFDYIFDGWYNGDKKWNFDEDVVNGALNLVAKYKEIKRKYTVSFNVTGNDSVTLASVEIEYGQIFDLSHILDGVDLSGYTYSITVGGLEKINIKVVEDVTVDVSFSQHVDEGDNNNAVDAPTIACFSGIGSGMMGVAAAAAIAFALKKRKED